MTIEFLDGPRGGERDEIPLGQGRAGLPAAIEHGDGLYMLESLEGGVLRYRWFTKPGAEIEIEDNPATA